MKMPAPDARTIVITGATGTGKSALGVEVAERLGGAIVSADSRQVYRHMDIGTAKPSGALLDRATHYGLDLIEPDESYSAGRFARDSWRFIGEIHRLGRVPIIVGGTGLFLRALLSPLGPEPHVDAGRKRRLRRYLDGLPPEELKRWLARLDPKRATALRNEGGPQRLARSLEVALMSGYSHSSWLDGPPDTAPLPAVVFCLELAREALYLRINARFDRMMGQGLLEEVRRLCRDYPADAPGLRSMGYAELARYLRGEISLETAVAEAKRNTRRFARRQLTWFRHQLSEDTIWLDASRPTRELAAEIARAWGERMPETGSETSLNIASDEPR